MNLAPIITTAGLDAVINATSDGLNAKIVSIVLGDTAWEPDAAAIALQNERARVPISGSTRINPTQLHLTAIENGDVEYWVREIGFVLEDDTLLAVWSQPDQDRPLAYKAAAIDLLLGFDVVLSALPADSVIVEDSGGLNLGPATLTVAGVVKMATEAEALDKTRSDVAMSPATTAALLTPATSEDAGIVRYATAEESVDDSRNDIALTPATLPFAFSESLTLASTTEVGIVRLATEEEVEERVRDDLAVTPATLGEMTPSLTPATQDVAGVARFATTNESFNPETTNLLMSPATVKHLGDKLYKQRLVFGPVQTTGFVNALDGELDFTVPPSAVMVGINSLHDNGTEDRRFRIRYQHIGLDKG